MAQNQHKDPYPWLTIDDEGKEFRVHPGRIDENDPDLTGWTFAPRSDEELLELGFDITPEPEEDGDPYPWVTIDFDGSEYRVHTAQEDGVDENGIVWQGWVYAPRTREQLDRAGF